MIVGSTTLSLKILRNLRNLHTHQTIQDEYEMLAARSLSCRGEEQVLGKTLSSSKFAIKKHKNQFCLIFAPYVTGILQATCYMQKGVLGITSYMWQKSYLFNNSSFEGLAIALGAAGAEAIMRLLP